MSNEKELLKIVALKLKEIALEDKIRTNFKIIKNRGAK